MLEPRSKNEFKVSYNVWKMWTEEERHHHNKLLMSMYVGRERLKVPKEILTETWFDICKETAYISTDLIRRGKLAEYYRR